MASYEYQPADYSERAPTLNEVLRLLGEAVNALTNNHTLEECRQRGAEAFRATTSYLIDQESAEDSALLFSTGERGE